MTRLASVDQSVPGVLRLFEEDMNKALRCASCVTSKSTPGREVAARTPAVFSQHALWFATYVTSNSTLAREAAASTPVVFLQSLAAHSGPCSAKSSRSAASPPQRSAFPLHRGLFSRPVSHLLHPPLFQDPMSSSPRTLLRQPMQ